MSRPRDYEEEKNHGGALCPTGSHPLAAGGHQTTHVDSNPKSNQSPTKKISSSSVFSDPLSRALEGFDPLSQFASSSKDDEIHEPAKSSAATDLSDEVSQQWLKHRTGILSKFTTTENLSITSSFLQGGEKCKKQNNLNISTKILLLH